MAKDASSFVLSLGKRPEHETLTRWLLDELRSAILDGRLKPGTRLPATRDFARQYGVSRGTVVTVFQQLHSDGYLTSRVGGGTWVNERLANRTISAVARPIRSHVPPAPLVGLSFPRPARPFRMSIPAVSEFPMKVWARVGSRRLRAISSSFLAAEGLRGFRPLREAIAAYLGSSRAVNCHPDQVVILSGVQQGLDLLSRLLLKPGDAAWTEDPGYFGTMIAFRNAGANLVPVPVGEAGIRVSEGKRLCANAKIAYVTPGHQFPLGITMSLGTRLELLAWARTANAFVIEDDYDSEHRFRGNPMPSLQSLDRNGNVIFLGTFNKLLFPALRLGYVVLPPSLVDPFLALRYGTDLRCSGLDQAILCDFIVEGHFGRHIRRMRELYSGRLAALLDAGQKYLKGLMDLSQIQAGLHITGLLRNGMSSRAAETAGLAKNIDTMGLDRLTLRRTDLNGLVMGFAGFDEGSIRSGIATLTGALEAGA